MAAWLDQTLSAPERRHLDAHVRRCDACRLLIALVVEEMRRPSGGGSLAGGRRLAIWPGRALLSRLPPALAPA